MRLSRVLTVLTLALLLAACGRVETTAQPDGTPINGDVTSLPNTSATTDTGVVPPAGAAPTAGVASAAPAAPTKIDPSQIKTLPDGLKYADLTPGTGAEATAGKQVQVHYTGWLENGTKFDSSLDRGEPFPLTLGGGQVIKGWDEGLVGMKVGGKRQLIIPPDLGYGAQAQGPIPANSTLIFEVEMLDVK